MLLMRVRDVDVTLVSLEVGIRYGGWSSFSLLVQRSVPIKFSFAFRR
jgi:hypothetical protein